MTKKVIIITVFIFLVISGMFNIRLISSQAYTGDQERQLPEKLPDKYLSQYSQIAVEQFRRDIKGEVDLVIYDENNSGESEEKLHLHHNHVRRVVKIDRCGFLCTETVRQHDTMMRKRSALKSTQAVRTTNCSKEPGDVIHKITPVAIPQFTHRVNFDMRTKQIPTVHRATDIVMLSKCLYILI